MAGRGIKWLAATDTLALGKEKLRELKYSEGDFRMEGTRKAKGLD